MRTTIGRGRVSHGRLASCDTQALQKHSMLFSFLFTCTNWITFIFAILMTTKIPTKRYILWVLSLQITHPHPDPERNCSTTTIAHPDGTAAARQAYVGRVCQAFARVHHCTFYGYVPADLRTMWRHFPAFLPTIVCDTRHRRPALCQHHLCRLFCHPRWPSKIVSYLGCLRALYAKVVV